MRQVTVVLIFISCISVCIAQPDNWGPASPISNYWQDTCGNVIGFWAPAIFPNDSLIMFTHSCIGQDRLACSEFIDGTWLNPIDISVPGCDPFVFCSQDTTIYFSSYDYGGYGYYDIFAARFRNFAVDSIWNLGPEINTSADESSPSLTSDGQKIFFLRSYTIMYSEKVNGQFGQPVPLPECINDTSAYQEWSPRISADGLKLYFTRSYGMIAPAYMFVSYFINNNWQEPISLNNNINFRYNEPDPGEPYSYASDPVFSRDGAKMYFTYNGCVHGERRAILMSSQLTDSSPSIDNIIPSDFSLSAYPNPFNSQTLIELDGNPKAFSNLLIYNLSGQLVRTLPARSKVIWEGRDNRGKSHVSGIYFVKVTGANRYQTLRLTLLR